MNALSVKTSYWGHLRCSRRTWAASPLSPPWRRETFAKSIESMTSQKTRRVEGVDGADGWKMSDHTNLSTWRSSKQTRIRGKTGITNLVTGASITVLFWLLVRYNRNTCTKNRNSRVLERFWVHDGSIALWSSDEIKQVRSTYRDCAREGALLRMRATESVRT
jgi:hypothetical protein